MTGDQQGTDPGTTTQECPKGEPHTVMPDGYLQWHTYAEELSLTHKQRRCPGCGLYALWVPKQPRAGRA